MVEAAAGEPGQPPWFEWHLASCPGCAAEFQSVRSSWQVLGKAAAIQPPDGLRPRVLQAVRAARQKQVSVAPRVSPLRYVLLGLAAAIASVVLVVAHDPDCRSPLAVACCSATWAGVYGLGFAVMLGSRRGSPIRALASRALLAAIGGLLLVRACPTEPGERLAVPFLSALATAAMTSVPWALLLGLLVGAVPLTISLLLVRTSGITIRSQLGTAGLYLAAVAPALYLESSSLALAGLLALLTGTVLGALGPMFSEWMLRRPSMRLA